MENNSDIDVLEVHDSEEFDFNEVFLDIINENTDNTQESLKVNIHKACGRKKVQQNLRKQIKLSHQELEKTKELGILKIREDAILYINSIKTIIPESFKPTTIVNHPILTAIYATGTCCRDCIQSCYKIGQWSTIKPDDCELLSRKIIQWIQFQSSTDQE